MYVFTFFMLHIDLKVWMMPQKNINIKLILENKELKQKKYLNQLDGKEDV